MARWAGSPTLVGSVVASGGGGGPAESNSSGHRWRPGREAGEPPAALQADILARLVGHWHARCALHYFLCYLLSSSVTILVCLRLLRLCHLQPRPSAKEPAREASATRAGFYYRTRLGECQHRRAEAEADAEPER